MADYPYCTVTNKLAGFLGKIKELGVPGKVNTRWLPTIGYSSKNDRSILPVLKFIGLITTDGTPTKVWLDFRGSDGGKALGKAIKSAYAELFRTYPNAQNRSTEELQAFFRGHSSYGSQAVGKAVATFKVLSQYAEFNDVYSGVEEVTGESIPNAIAGPQPQVVSPLPGITAGQGSLPSLHIDIQIHISPEANADQIEKIFESMAKHLYKNG